MACKSCMEVVRQYVKEKNCKDYLALTLDFLDPQHGDCDNQPIANAVYCLLWGPVLAPETDCFAELCGTGKAYRGDTINSYNTVCKNTAQKYTFYDGSYDEQIAHFHKSYHCIANFMPLGNTPSSLIEKSNTLNSHRGNYNRYGDFFDLFLSLVADWYSGNTASWNTEQLDLFARNKVSYFDKFDGFEEYIDKNYLTCYVDDHYNILPLFRTVEDRLLKSPLPRESKDVFDYLNNAENIILERAVKITNELEHIIA